jgi:hypothetical protein
VLGAVYHRSELIYDKRLASKANASLAKQRVAPSLKPYQQRDNEGDWYRERCYE